MSDVKTEQLAVEDLGYPAILDEVDEADLVIVQDIMKKPRSLEGPAAERHNAWKKKTLIEVLGEIPPEAYLFVNMGGFVAEVAKILDQGLHSSERHTTLALAMVSGFGAVASAIVIGMKKKREQVNEAV